MIDWFSQLSNAMNLKCRDDRLFFLIMTLAFHFFMRVSEVLDLRPQDIQVSEDKCLLVVHFWKTKTDQFAAGTTSYIGIRGDVSCPSRYLDAMEQLPRDRPIFAISQEAMNSKLRVLLDRIGIENVEGEVELVVDVRDEGVRLPDCRLEAELVELADPLREVVESVRRRCRRSDVSLSSFGSSRAVEVAQRDDDVEWLCLAFRRDLDVRPVLLHLRRRYGG